MEQLPDWMRAIEQTYVAKFPQQHLSTFGATNISYFVVTEPIYTVIDSNKKDLEGVLRKGRVIAEKPTLITPTYAMNLDGFSQSAYDYMKHSNKKYDYIYIDFMFEKLKNKSLSSKNDETLKMISFNDNDKNKIIQLAQRVSNKKVIVKEPRNSLSDILKPNHIIKTKLLKFNIYLRNNG